MKFSEIPQFTQRAPYAVDEPILYFLEKIEKDWVPKLNLQLSPDFQRAHVWNKEKQTRYVEYLLRGGQSSRDLYFNHPNWMGSWKGDFVLVDGKQRLEAIRSFIHSETMAFGYYIHQYEDKLTWNDLMVRVHINTLKTRAEVLQWYLDLNEGGVVHTEEELKKVRQLLFYETNPLPTMTTISGQK